MVNETVVTGSISRINGNKLTFISNGSNVTLPIRNELDIDLAVMFIHKNIYARITIFKGEIMAIESNSKYYNEKMKSRIEVGNKKRSER